MTALDRARGWFIGPPPPSSSTPTGWSAPPPTSPDDALAAAPLSGEAPALRSRGGKRRTRPPLAGEWIAESAAEASLAVTSAAVLGRAGEVEPVAAALALALRLQTRARAAAVAVAGAVPPEVEGATSGAAARRLGARLEDHGLEAHVRGRLAWVRLEPGDPQFAAAARRVTLAAAPAVLAVTAARTDAVDEALNEQDLLVIVTDDPEGPLAQLAAAGLGGVPIVTVRPLGRGPARALARAGVRPARSLRQLLTTVPEATR